MGEIRLESKQVILLPSNLLVTTRPQPQLPLCASRSDITYNSLWGPILASPLAGCVALSSYLMSLCLSVIYKNWDNIVLSLPILVKDGPETS